VKILLLFVLILIYKFAVNLIQRNQVISIKNSYIEWIRKEYKGRPLSQHIPKIKRLVNNAGIKEQYLPTAQPLGYLQIATITVNVLDGFPSLYQDKATITMRLLEQAIGVYQTRMFEGFTPKFWIDLIVFLPRNIIKYLGLNPDTVAVKLLQVFWWVLSPIAIIFRDNIYDFVSVFLSNLK